MKTAERQQAENVLDIEKSHVLRYQFSRKNIPLASRVLDYGCGCGYGSYILAQGGHEVVGCDVDQESIQFSIENYHHPNACFIRTEDLSYEKAFDAIVLLEVLEHLEEPETILKRILRKLRKEGTFIISTPDQDVRPFDAKRFPFHFKHFTKSELTELLDSHRLKVIGKFNQPNKIKPEILNGWGGFSNITVCEKQ